MHHNPHTIKFLLVLIASKNKDNFPLKLWYKGILERKLLVLPNLPTHSSQNKTYGNPFLQQGSPVLQVQMRSSQDHRFFCKEKHHRFTVYIWAHRLFTQWSTDTAFDSYPVSTYFPIPRSKFLEDSVLLQQHKVDASCHFTLNKPLGFGFSFILSLPIPALSLLFL